MATGQLSEGAYQKAVQDLNDELANQVPMVNDVADAWADWLSRGFTDFKSFADDILGSFKGLLTQMIATAARNRILIDLGVAGGGGVAGTVAQAAGGGGGLLGGLLGGGGAGGGILGGLLGKGTIGGSFLGGITNTIGAFGSGISTGLASIGGQISAALTGSLTGIAGAVGALVPVVGAVAGIASLLKGAFSRTFHATGFTGQLSPEGFDGYQETHYKGSTFKSGKSYFSDVPAELQAALDDGAKDVTQNVTRLAEGLGLATDGFKEFESVAFGVSSTSPDIAQEKIQEALEKSLRDLADGLADTVFDASAWAIADETSSQTLERLSNSLQSVNQIFATLDLTLLDISLASADAASSFIDLFDSIENLNAAASAYYQAFHTEQERFHDAADDVAQAFRDLNVQMPKNRAQFRDLMEAQDTATEAGRRMVAELLKIAPAFDGIMSAASNIVKAQISSVQSNISDLNSEIAAQQDIIRQAQRDREAALRSVEQANQAVASAQGQLEQARQAQARLAAQSAKEAAAARLAAAQDSLQSLSRQRDDLMSSMESDYEEALDIASRLADTARSVMSINDDIAEIQRINALRQLRIMLETGRIDADRLDALTDAATNFGDTFETRVDMLRAQARTAQTIAALSDMQLEIAEQERQVQLDQLAALEAQIAAAQDAVDAIEAQTAAQEAAAKAAEVRAAANATMVAESALASAQGAAADAAKQAAITIAAADAAEAAALEEIARLEAEISVEEKQLSALEKQLSVLEQILAKTGSAPVENLATVVNPGSQAAVDALGDEAFTQTSQNGGNAIISDPATQLLTGNAKAVNQLYLDVLGRSADVAGLNFYTSLLDSGKLSLAQIEADLRSSAEGATGITPGFANGGVHAGGWRMVGERGRELEYTPPSRIYSNAQTEKMLGGDPEVRKELVRLNEYIRELVKINNKQERRLREIELQGETA